MISGLSGEIGAANESDAAVNQMPDKSKFWNDARLQRIGFAAAAALLLAILLSGQSAVRESGDFPALYGQIKILERGQLAQLYDFSTQQSVQSEFYNNRSGAFLPGVYPPYYYLVLSPLALLSPQVAKLLWDSAALCAFLFALLILARRNQFVQRHIVLVTAMMLLTPCFIAAVFGGQNTCFVLALTLLAATLLSRPNKVRHFFGGVCLGLLFFKPQYGALALIILLLSRSANALFGYVIVAVSLWSVAALTFGANWVFEWASRISTYAVAEYSLSLGQMTSCDAALAWILKLLKQPLPTALPLIGVFVGLIGCLSFLNKKLTHVRAGQEDFFFVPICWLAVLPIISPHTIYYDLGLALAAAFAIAPFESDRSRSALLGGWLVLMLYGWTKNQWHAPILFVFALILGGIIWSRRPAHERKAE